jgi:MFS family permease
MLRLSTRSLRLPRRLTLSALSAFQESQNVGNEVAVRNFSSTPDDTQLTPKSGLFEKYFGLESNIAPESFKNRWAMVVPAFITHMAIGSTWAWSLTADVVTREQGFVAPAAADWTMMDSVFPLSMVFAVLGFSASALGKWQMKVGTRKAIAAASVTFGGGCLLGAAGIYCHNLPLLYLGYGGLAGLGLGLSYTPPVQTLMQWFPDKKGLASGLTIAGFGSGALVYTPIAQYLMKHFAKMPEYLGPANEFVTQVVDGKLFADVNGALVEVVRAGTAELAKIPYSLPEGLYVVGTGATGAAETLALMGGVYFSVLLASALAIRKPHPAYVAPVAVVKQGGFVAPVPAREITLDEAMRQPQFYMLGVSFFCLAAGGIGMMGVAKPMMSEVFSAVLPTVVTSDFAAKYILMLSAGNLGKCSLLLVNPTAG